MFGTLFRPESTGLLHELKLDNGASLWVVNKPVTAKDYFLLCDALFTNKKVCEGEKYYVSFDGDKLQHAQDLDPIKRLRLAAFLFAYTPAYQFKDVEIGYYEKISMNIRMQTLIDSTFNIDEKKLCPEIGKELKELKDKHVENALDFIKKNFHIKKHTPITKVSQFLSKELTAKNSDEKRRAVSAQRKVTAGMMESQIKLVKKLKNISVNPESIVKEEKCAETLEPVIGQQKRL